MNREWTRAGRIWVAIFAAYAIALQILAPVEAGAARMAAAEPWAQLCDGSTVDQDGVDEDGGDRGSSHHQFCCILCAPAAVAGLPAAVAASALSPPDEIASGLPVPRGFASRAPPERDPIVPRGPPVPA